MADETKKKSTRIITPRFIAAYAWLSTPNLKHDKDGKFQVSGVFDPKVPEQRAFLGQLKTLHKANVAEQQAKFKPTKKQPTMKVQDCMTQEEDGRYRVNFSESAFLDVVDKATQQTKRVSLKPTVVDAKGKETDVEVWSGSTIKAAIDVWPFYNGSLGAGLSLKLKGVQVIDLRTRGSRDGASLGFGVEDGFSSAEQSGDASLAGEFSDSADVEETTAAPVAELVDDEEGEAPAAAPAVADDFDF